MKRSGSFKEARPTIAMLKYWEMRAGLSPKPFVDKALETGLSKSPREALDSFEGMLQWLAYHATKQNHCPSVMMSGVIDRMFSTFHSIPGQYVSFCDKYVGYVVGRKLIRPNQTGAVRDSGGIEYMVSELRKAFGTELTSALNNWSRSRAVSGSVTSLSFVDQWLQLDDEDTELEDFSMLWKTAT
jgi:hypothetical protein